MRTCSTNEERSTFAEVINIARRELVAIAKNGKVVSIIIAKEVYEHYQTIEKERWVDCKTISAKDVTNEVNSRIEKLKQKP